MSKQLDKTGPQADTPEIDTPGGLILTPSDEFVEEGVLPSDPPVDTPSLQAPPPLPDEYEPDDQSDGIIRVDCYPGYVASFWPFKQDGLRQAMDKGVHLAKVGEGYVLREELYSVSQDGNRFLLYGDLVIGVETINHAQQRFQKDIVEKAMEPIRHLMATQGQAVNPGEDVQTLLRSFNVFEEEAGTV